jgi:hypothetical protein
MLSICLRNINDSARLAQLYPEYKLLHVDTQQTDRQVATLRGWGGNSSHAYAKSPDFLEINQNLKSKGNLPNIIIKT